MILKNKKRDVIVLFCCFIVLWGIANITANFSSSGNSINSKQYDLQRIYEEKYNAVFLSMYDISNYSEEGFSIQNDKQTIILQTKVEDFNEFLFFVEEIKKASSQIDTIYFGIDPTRLWDANCIAEDRKYIQDMSLKINSVFKQYGDIAFEIILPYPNIQYWTTLGTSEMKKELELYEKIVTLYSEYENVAVHYIGAEEWLVCYTNNYGDDYFSVNAEAAELLSDAIVEKKYAVTTDLIKAQNLCLLADVASQNLLINPYEDLSDWNIVFWGDSIIGLEHSNTSIPNIVTRLTGARTYNMGIGGASASDGEKKYCSFNEMLDAILLNTIDDLPENANFMSEVQRFNEEYQEKEKLCFVINFGINDYINGFSVKDEKNPNNKATYMGALRMGIQKLKKQYPNAQFVIMAPTYINSFSEGTEPNDTAGAMLLDYRIAAQSVAEEFGVHYKNNYEDLEIDASNYWVYLWDDIHLNGIGRFYFAEQFVRFFEENVLTSVY